MRRNVSETFLPWDKKFQKLFVLGLKRLVPWIKFMQDKNSCDMQFLRTMQSPKNILSYTRK